MSIRSKMLGALCAAVALSALGVASPQEALAQQAQLQIPKIGEKSIGGVVRGTNGPEVGVWVIAETTELPTRFARIVVTDDQGRYLIPDLPTANYEVWVRGYGLVDSPKLRAKPGIRLDHTAITAPNEAAAAHYYPALYWYTMMNIPPAGEFGGKSTIPDKLTQSDWLRQMNNVDCIGCHQLGQEFDVHDFGAVRQSGRRGSLDAAHAGRPSGRDDDQPPRRPMGWRAV